MRTSSSDEKKNNDVSFEDENSESKEDNQLTCFLISLEKKECKSVVVKGYKEIQQQIGGFFSQFTAIKKSKEPPIIPNILVYCDEEARCKKDCKNNSNASSILSKLKYTVMLPIYGKILILKENPETGDEDSLTESEIKIISELL